MFMIVPSIVIAVVLLLVLYLVARSPVGMAGAWALAAVATVLSVMLLSMALFLFSLGTLIVAIVCSACRLRPRMLLLSSTAVMAASFGFMLMSALPELRELHELRVEYPVESIAARLQYENQREDVDAADVVVAGQIAKRLLRFDERYSRWGDRADQLAWLHNRTQDDFVLARGFGPIRMGSVSREHVDLRDPPPVPIPPRPESAPDYPSTEQPPELLAAAHNVAPAQPSQDALLSMHDNGLTDFLDADRMGYAENRDHVVGFVPHRFLSVPQIDDEEEATSKWQVVRLDLISLLKHAEPVAYVSEHLPQMDELQDAPTRPLDTFEQQALGRLRSEEDLVIDEQPGRIRMVGSLRAGRSCLDCHSVHRGELLGAFSYELVPGGRLPPKEEQPQEPKA